MSKRIIKKVAVLGSGVMGSRIACHFAGIGLQVLLLDIAPTGLNAGRESERSYAGSSCGKKQDRK